MDPSSQVKPSGEGQSRPSAQIALFAMIQAAESISRPVSEFGNWMTAGCGASFALILVNLDSLSPFIDRQSLTWCLRWFAIAIVLGFVEAFCRVWVSTMAGAVKAADEIGLYRDAAALEEYRVNSLSAIFPHMRWFARWRASKAVSGDSMALGRDMLRWSQVQGHCALTWIA